MKQANFRETKDKNEKSAENGIEQWKEKTKKEESKKKQRTHHTLCSERVYLFIYWT